MFGTEGSQVQELVLNSYVDMIQGLFGNVCNRDSLDLRTIHYDV